MEKSFRELGLRREKSDRVRCVHRPAKKARRQWDARGTPGRRRSPPGLQQKGLAAQGSVENLEEMGKCTEKTHQYSKVNSRQNGKPPKSGHAIGTF